MASREVGVALEVEVLHIRGCLDSRQRVARELLLHTPAESGDRPALRGRKAMISGRGTPDQLDAKRLVIEHAAQFPELPNRLEVDRVVAEFDSFKGLATPWISAACFMTQVTKPGRRAQGSPGLPSM